MASGNRKAIESGTFFLACFSENFDHRHRHYMNEELVLAVEELRKRSRDRSWFIPVLIATGSVPDLSIGAGETLRDIQWVDMHSNWAEGLERLLRVLGQVGSTETQGRWTTILFTDIAGGTQLAESQNENDLARLVQDVGHIQQSAVRGNGGTILGTPGESVMAGFASVDAALDCASQIQSLVTRYADGRSLVGLRLRIGLDAGQVVETDGTFHGAPTHGAARICSRAKPGQVLVSGAVEERIDKRRFRVVSRSTAMFKGNGSPVQLFAVEELQS